MSEPWRGAPDYDRHLEDAGAASGPFSFPWDAPLVPPFPIRFRDVSILTLCYRTNPEAIARLLPPPLESTGDVVVVHVYRMPDVDFIGQAHECNVMVGAALDRGDERVAGGYSTALYLDSDAGIAHGREVHGQPKKLARLSLAARGDLIVGEVMRNEIPILTGTLPYKQRAVDPAALRRHFDFTENINYKVIPHIDGSPAIRQLTARRLTNSRSPSAGRGRARSSSGRTPRPPSGCCRSWSPSKASSGRPTSRSSAAACSMTTWRPAGERSPRRARRRIR